MRLLRVLPLLLASVFLGGCEISGFVRQVFSSNLGALAKYGGASIPGQDQKIIFTRITLNDDRLAEAFRFLQSYAPTELSFREMPITDLSVSLLIQLDSVEDLRLEGTQISARGLTRLRPMRHLRRLGVSRFSPPELAAIRKALPGIDVDVDNMIDPPPPDVPSVDDS